MRYRSPLALLAFAIGSACSNSTGTQMAGNVAVSVATQSPRVSSQAAALSRAKALDDTITSGADTIIVTRAQLVLREIELKRVESPNCDGADECEKVEFGPVLVDLPLQPGADRKFTVEPPRGSYDEIEFDVHKPDDGDPDDQVFIQQNPEFERISIRVQGTFNDAPFVYESDLDVEQELTLQPPLVVDENTATNVTIFVGLDSWFRMPNGMLVDPATANKDGPNENLVKDNIITSMRAFEDRDEDGDDRDG